MPDSPTQRRQAQHAALWAVCRKLPTDHEPYGNAERTGGDCSAGCRFYRCLAGHLGGDWGVCGNPASPRAGLLTFEHQGGAGCFERDGDDAR